MHNHLGKQLVIQDSKSADLTPMIKLLSGSPCVHAVRNYVTQQYMICTKYNSVYTWLYKINICNIYISVKTVTRSYIISIYSVKTVTRSTHRQTSNSYCIAPSTQPNINVKYNFSWFTWYTICCKKIDPGNMGQLIQY